LHLKSEPPVEDLSFVTPLKNLDFYEPPEEFQSENVEPLKNSRLLNWNFRQTPKNSSEIFDKPRRIQGEIFD
jgi:hypothetical protein